MSTEAFRAAIDQHPLDAPTLAKSLALSISAFALWTLTHHYAGLVEDGEIYAFQALARLHPYLSGDLYLQNTSQDSFTIFSPLYAMLIRALGLRVASTLLFAFCAGSFFVAAWFIVRRHLGNWVAWLSLAMLIGTTMPYGSYGVFKIPEDYLTARSLAEALVVTSLAAQSHRHHWLATAAILAALFVHPLMALPGLLLLACMVVPSRVALLSASAGITGIALFIVAATLGLSANPYFRVMDPSWLNVVQERSQFLFLQYWTLADWEVQVRPLLCLVITFAVLDGPPRKLAASAILVGVSGLAIAAIASEIGPVAVFLQGQTWRWLWVSNLFAVLLLAPTAFRLWRDGGCGYLCAVLLFLGWTFPPVNGTLMVSGAAGLFALRSRIPHERDAWLKAAAYLLIGIATIWTLATEWTLLNARPLASARVAFNILRDLFNLRIFSLLIFGLSVFAIARYRRSTLGVAMLAGALLIAAFPVSVSGAGGFAALGENREFSDWRAVIPESSNVMLLPASKTAHFAWFTLERPSYLSLSQSAGVVFSPATAAEVRRRSDVLTPVARPDWKILSRFRQIARGERPDDKSPPLTAAGLQSICSDPALRFVVAKEALGFGAVRHTQRGVWKDWNLYDCTRVRGASGGA